MAGDFPDIRGSGSLILAWQVKGRRVIVVGGGEVAAGRIFNLLCADALVRVVCPSAGLSREVRHRLATVPPCLLTHVDRNFEASDLDDPAISMVLTAVDDPEASSNIYKLCKDKRIPANIADVPPECDFYFGSVHRDGPLQIMVSTNGNGPKMASLVRKQIANDLPDNLGEAITKVGRLRQMLRGIAPATEEGSKRMGWMSRVCELWALEDLCEMNELDMSRLLEYYAPNKVPTLSDIRSID